MVATLWCWQYCKLSSCPLSVLLPSREYFSSAGFPFWGGDRLMPSWPGRGSRDLCKHYSFKEPQMRAFQPESAFQCAIAQQSSVCGLKSTWAVGQVSLDFGRWLGARPTLLLFHFRVGKSFFICSDFLMTDVDRIFSRCAPLYINRISFWNQDGTATLHCIMIEVLLS